MRTIIDIPMESLIPLDALCREAGVSRAEAIRRSIDLFIAQQERKRKKVRLEDGFGLFKHHSPFGDGLEYQRKIRAEWDDREHVIDAWIEHQKKNGPLAGSGIGTAREKGVRKRPSRKSV